MAPHIRRRHYPITLALQLIRAMIQKLHSPHPIQERLDSSAPPFATPRILVIAEFAPGSAGGSWVIIKQLLRGLDWNQIHWWSFYTDESPKPYNFGGRHHSANIPSKLSPKLRWKELKGMILENIAVPYAARDLQAYIREVQPDFIFFLAHCWGIPVVNRVMPHVKAHWHLEIHDMPDTASWVKSMGRRRIDRFMGYTEDLYLQADSRAVIGPEMAEDMRQRTGISCTNVFRCAVEPEILARLAEAASPPRDEIIRIGYAGTILAEATFARLIVALKKVGSRLNRKIELHLYSWHSYKNRAWFDPDVVIEHGARTEAEVYEEYRKMTWGLSIMKLDDDDPRYNRLSFPCKFTAALAAGIPLICIGNRHSSLMEMAKDYRLGLVLTEEDEPHFEDRMCEVLPDFSKFDVYRSEILRCARKEFNAGRNREELHEMMGTVAKRP